MKNKTAFLVILLLASFVSAVCAQDVSIPDPGLNAAVREALNKPIGPLTTQDMLTLTNLDARDRNVKKIDGLQAARNLQFLDLQFNHLTNFSLPTELTNLLSLNLAINRLTNVTIPSSAAKLANLSVEANNLAKLVLPTNLTRLNSLDVSDNHFHSFILPTNFAGLIFLDVGFNSLTNCALPSGLTNLDTLILAGNLFTNLTLPADLNGLTQLFLDQNQLTNVTFPAGMTNLLYVDLFFNQLRNLVFPADVKSLLSLDLDFNQFSSLTLSSNLTSLVSLHVRANQLTNLNFPANMAALNYLDVGDNQLSRLMLPPGLNRLSTLRLSGNQFTTFNLPPGLTNLTALNFTENPLTNLTLPSDLGRLESLNLGGNQLVNLTLPAEMTNLVGLFLTGNLLTNITLPPDLTQLVGFGYLGNPLTTFVLPEFLASTTLSGDVAALRDLGIPVFTYPLTPELVRVRRLIGATQFGITGPPGIYSVQSSSNLVEWSLLRVITNAVGSIAFDDVTAQLLPSRFYRTILQAPPANMVFVPPNTFTMGSLTNEVDRSSNEGPQTTVTLTRGYWIGKFEVTQGEYVSVMNTNPSAFPGDLTRAVSSVSWLDATNYCAKLTKRELAEGRIPPGSKYRLPTEAEWECAARAGTTSRFSFGDDPGYSILRDHSWFASNSGIVVHSVGQKLPNPWGLYDTEGNVLEWCQDWFALFPGGNQTDPTGPASNPSTRKVTRGGAFDNSEQSCRSASRGSFGVSPFLTDTDLGFRVVLVTEP